MCILSVHIRPKRPNWNFCWTAIFGRSRGRLIETSLLCYFDGWLAVLQFTSSIDYRNTFRHFLRPGVIQTTWYLALSASDPNNANNQKMDTWMTFLKVKGLRPQQTYSLCTLYFWMFIGHVVHASQQSITSRLNNQRDEYIMVAGKLPCLVCVARS